MNSRTLAGHGLTIGLQAIAWLAEAAVDQLWYADQEDGCCPRCCAPCAALKQLLDAGQLDQLLTHAPGTTASDWWLTDHLGRSGIDRGWLTRAWRMTGCCKDATGVVEQLPFEESK